MSTHALVGVMHGTKFKAIYVHSDGYLRYTGKVLLEHYNSTKANNLVAMGDCSVLGKEIGNKVSFNDPIVFEDGVAVQCRFYGRDRDECSPFATYNSVAEALSNWEHVYVMDTNGVWQYYTYGNKAVTLESALHVAVV